MDWRFEHGKPCDKCGGEVGCCGRAMQETNERWARALQILAKIAVPASGVDLAGGELNFGNLPWPCPSCGRMRLNYFPEDNSIACEKCDTRWPKARDEDEKSGGHDPWVHCVYSPTQEMDRNRIKYLEERLDALAGENAELRRIQSERR